MRNSISKIFLIVISISMVLLIILLSFFMNEEITMEDLCGNRNALGDMNIVYQKSRGSYETDQIIISKNKDSKIVSYQEKSDYNILTNQPFDEKDGSMNTKEIMLGYLGKDVKPNVIYLYPKDFESKKEITTYLDKYNEGKEEKNVVEYTDMAAMISTLSGNIMDAITVVLVAFSSISLIVSSIMIAIITYISVLERIK